MSFEEALLAVLPPPNSWKKSCAIAEELRRMEIDYPKPEVIEPHTIHPVLSALASVGKVRCQPAVRSVHEPRHSGYEYQRSC